MCRFPLPPSIKQVSQEENSVWVKLLLQGNVGALHVVIRVCNGRLLEQPWSPRIAMRIDELGIREEDQMMRRCFFWLSQTRCQPCSPWPYHARKHPYPILPISPLARLDCTLENPSLAPEQCHQPYRHKQMRQTEQPPPMPIPLHVSQ